MKIKELDGDLDLPGLEQHTGIILLFVDCGTLIKGHIGRDDEYLMSIRTMKEMMQKAGISSLEDD